MVASGPRPTNEYRPQRSPPSTDSSRKPGWSVPSTIWRKAATGVSVSATSSRHTGTIRCLAAKARNSWRAPGPEGPAASAGRAAALTDRSAEGPVEAGAVPGVAGAVAVLVDQSPTARPRRSRSARSARTGGRPTSRPCTRTPAAPAPEPRTSGLEGTDQRLVVHPGEHEHGAVGGILDDGRHQPSALKTIRSSSWSENSIGHGVGSGGGGHGVVLGRVGSGPPGPVALTGRALCPLSIRWRPPRGCPARGG